ncbi:MAG: MltA domain-containing protein, partial [Alphaproteobacteria bacterium]|nr:MltA domain-containing protein [Alphaproteobacteria bacterium]
QSCSWWLEHNRMKPLHPLLTGNQHTQWLAFCNAVTRSHTIAHDLPLLMGQYLERVEYAEKAFFTGYYEPTLKGSYQQNNMYPTPLYKAPPSPNHSEKLPTREAIRNGALSHQNLELIYVNDPIDAFFLEIQGSGRIDINDTDKKLMRVGYASQNGHPFTPIGHILKERGDIPAEKVSLQSIKKWLRDHPKSADALMDHNKSYVFFQEILDGDTFSGPIGTQQLPLTPFHSLACDASHWPFGMIIAYDLKHPLSSDPLTHMALTQDTGGAIKGHLRFDLFCGHGQDAENLAGNLKHFGKVAAYLPKNNPL